MITRRSAKQKGKNLEKEIRNLIIEAFDLDEQDIRVPIGSEQGADLKLSIKAKQKFPFSLELKRRKSLDTLYSFYAQASKHYPELIPAVILRADYKKNSLIVLDFDHFLSILSNKTIKVKATQRATVKE